MHALNTRMRIVQRTRYYSRLTSFPRKEDHGKLGVYNRKFQNHLTSDVSGIWPYLYHVEDGVGEPLMSQARVSLPPTRAAEPMRRRPKVGDALGDALQARTTCDLPLLCPAQIKLSCTSAMVLMEAVMYH